MVFATGAPVNSDHQLSDPGLTTVVPQFLFHAVALKGLPFFLIVCGYFNAPSVITEHPPDVLIFISLQIALMPKQTESLCIDIRTKGIGYRLRKALFFFFFGFGLVKCLQISFAP